MMLFLSTKLSLMFLNDVVVGGIHFHMHVSQAAFQKKDEATEHFLTKSTTALFTFSHHILPHRFMVSIAEVSNESYIL